MFIYVILTISGIYVLSIVYSNTKYLKGIGLKKFISNKINLLNMVLVAAFAAFAFIRIKDKMGLPLGI